MITDKKNQHYIPKFYLRNFSFQRNQKQIGVFNINNGIFVQKSKIKTQGSKNFFYGHDGVIENNLSEIEGHLATIIRQIIFDLKLPKKNSDQHYDLLSFVALTDLRNPVNIESLKKWFIEMEKGINQIYPEMDSSTVVPMINHDESIRLSLSHTIEIVDNIRDLDYKLLINETEIPFITSDFPIVKYNLFLENKKWQFARTGYGLVGLKIFVPLNSKITLVIYDSRIYKIGNKKDIAVKLKIKSDIDQLNILQYINCFKTIYFDDKATEDYIKSIHQKSQKYQRSNQVRSNINYITFNKNEEQFLTNREKEHLIILNKTDCNINLNLSCLKIHSTGKYHKLNPSMSQLRKHPEKLSIRAEFQKRYSR